MKKTMLAFGLVAGLLLPAGKSQATLFDRGNGLIYDSIDNISWTQDAGMSGMNNWTGQVAFANNLVFAGFDDFRLASITELVNLYGQLPGDFGGEKTGNIPPFVDIHSVYWSGTEVDAVNARFFFFLNGLQNSGNKSNITVLYGWAVRPGDSPPLVPEPSSAVLLAVASVALRLTRRWPVGQECCKTTRI
jgi:hypothetical protein